MPGSVATSLRRLLGWFDVRAYGARGDGSTDDTAAIQAAIDACATAGGGTVYFPLGVYKVAGAAQNTTAENSQITLPRVDMGSAAPYGIRLLGEAPPHDGWWVPEQMGASGPMLLSTYTGGDGTQSVLAGYSAFTSASNHFTCIKLAIQDLEIRCPVNPTLSALNLGGVLDVSLDRVYCSVGGKTGTTAWTQPTTSGASGVVGPRLNNGARVHYGQVTVAGYYYGYRFGEHTTGLDVAAFGCQVAATIEDSYHSLHLARFGSYFSANGVKVLASSQPPRITIANYAIEQPTAASSSGASPASWPARDTPAGYDWDDAANKAHGTATYNIVRSNVGVSQASWRANGGSGMTFTSMG